MKSIRDLIQTEELDQILGNPDVVIVDCRFDLFQTEWGREQYRQSHIPGAYYAHLDEDLSGVRTPQTGRHPLPDAEAFVRLLSAWGVTPNSLVVAYDQNGGAFAARLWWMLRYWGHERACVLDGGWEKWLRERRKTATEIPAPSKGTPWLTPKNDWLISTEEMASILGNNQWKIIDARAPQRYSGEEEPIDPVAGHIPGALNRFHGFNLAPDSTFLPPETLRKQFLELLGETPPDHTIVYCGSGVTSCHHLLAMSIAGLGMGKLYAGSWSEWIRDPNRPIRRGNQP